MKLKSILNCAGRRVAIGLLACLPATASAATPLWETREYVMGTFATVRIHAAPDRSTAAAAGDAAMAEIRALDRLLAVQRPDSELSRVNREAARGPVPVDPRTVAVVAASLDAHRLTEGAFDVTVLPVVRAFGFTDGRPHMPAAGAARRIAGSQAIDLDAAAGTIAFTDPATSIDLGGIAKGYALDRARELLRTSGVTSALLDLGGNVVTLGTPPGGGTWRLAIRHPRRRDVVLGMLEVGEAAVSTSGDAEQFVVDARGERHGHIIDPRTGRPASALVSATVVHRSATLGDALSTAAVVLGARRARALLPAAGAGLVLAGFAPGADRLTITATPDVRFHPEDLRVPRTGAAITTDHQPGGDS